MAINAWNEWAEAAYLEADVHFGAAYLNATARALARREVKDGKMRVALITHDAHPHGAQLLIKNMARVLIHRFGVEVSIIALGDGPLLDSYRALAPTHVVGRDTAALEQVLRQLRRDGYRIAIVNTTVSGRALPVLRQHGFFALSLVHELPQLIRDYSLEAEVHQIADLAHLVVFAAPQVRDAFASLAGGLDVGKTVIRAQGSYLPWRSDPGESRAVRARLGLRAADKVVINVGYADARKGFDLFVRAASAICDLRDDVHFAWVGPVDQTVVAAAMAEIPPGSNAAGRIHLVPFTPNPVPVFEAADAFFLSSREDPFPTVVLEAMKAGLPVVGFDRSGGSVDLIRTHGVLVPMGDVVAAAAAIVDLIDQSLLAREDAAAARRAIIDQAFRFEDYVSDLLAMAEPGSPRVSVIVPNYRYASYLPARLNSIYDQTCPLYEVLVLDDASPDDSLAELERYRQRTAREFEVIVNERNSGSGYVQWAKGARMARGDLIWIAEADDLAEPAFLAAARRVFEDPEVAFVFCDSSQRDETDRLLATGYGYYFDSVAPGAMAQDFVMEGPEFVRRFLSIKNLILNVSGVLWRREALLAALEATEADHVRMKVACDWKIYAHAALNGGKVGFVARPLNMHRRHAQSMTQARDVRAHYDEIIEVQDHIAGHLALGTETLARRDVYRAELRKQFGLD